MSESPIRYYNKVSPKVNKNSSGVTGSKLKKHGKKPVNPFIQHNKNTQSKKLPTNYDGYGLSYCQDLYKSK